jgi:hypothetical protein
MLPETNWEMHPEEHPGKGTGGAFFSLRGTALVASSRRNSRTSVK